eukprot:CAMPEP_0119000340 /NCGR_PEP_ID=MMETSP1173-20130426/64026_1 /TAXON_ID=1034831 /ORGANISM="Rhizochromulina marina cf, Strain CCMP1243" /LENGTH=474 /DNA_ID=CAMNT_0006951843 /DNA_START=157 /DNA_END=1581 /DNA_ORIENTATION=+
MGICPSADGSGCLPQVWLQEAQGRGARHAKPEEAQQQRLKQTRPIKGGGQQSGGRRPGRELRNHFSEGIIDTWGHRDIPLEISKVYELRHQIGEGTTSQVFLAVRRFDGKSFACKVIDKRLLPHEGSHRATILHQLRKEIEVLQQVDHPNIIRYEGMVETAIKLYCFMEYVHGCELYHYLLHNGPLEQEHCARVIHGVLGAVSHMHKRGIVHRDIKAENCMLSWPHGPESGPVVKLIDFGFATILNFSTTTSFLGTAGYLAPEIRQERFYYKSVDIWAVGVLTYLSLSCRLPFDRELDTLPKHKGELGRRFSLRFPEHVWSQEHDEVKDLLRGMLAIEPAKRMNAHECLRHPWVTGEHFGVVFEGVAPPTTNLAFDPSAMGIVPIDENKSVPSTTSASSSSASSSASSSPGMSSWASSSSTASAKVVFKMPNCVSVPRLDVLDIDENSMDVGDVAIAPRTRSAYPLLSGVPRTL